LIDIINCIETWNSIDDAVDGITDVLSRRHKERRNDEDHQRRLVVKTEDIAENKINVVVRVKAESKHFSLVHDFSQFCIHLK
jgi:hypothetical protein